MESEKFRLALVQFVVWMVGGLRSEVLDFLHQYPRRGRGHWTARAIAKKLDERENSVRKVTSKFQKCGVLEPQKAIRIVRRRVIKDAGGNLIERRTVTDRREIPCKFTDQGRRLAELMGFARQQGIFSLPPQKRRLADDPALLAKFRQAGFTEQEVRQAVDCGLIYERPSKVYAHEEGMIDEKAIVSALQPQIRFVEIRYKYVAL